MGKLTDKLQDLRAKSKTHQRDYKIFEGENIEESFYDEKGIKKEGEKILTPKDEALDTVLNEYKNRHRYLVRHPHMDTYEKLKRSKTVDVDKLLGKIFDY